MISHAFIETVQEKLRYTTALIKREPRGKLQHAYLVPGGPYSEQWDWDAFFMGVALGARDPKEGVYLRNWTLNFLDNADDDGKVAGCLTADGWDPRLRQMKPFLAQGALIASRFLGDTAWLLPVWEKLKTTATYRERNLWNKELDLGVWHDSMESGADNNVAALEHPQASVIATDLNAFMWREFSALSALATALSKLEEAALFQKRADDLLSRFNRLCWNEEDKIYWNFFAPGQKQVKRISYSSFVPLWAGMATQKDGKASIERYLLSEKHMLCEYGMRTLSAEDPTYNNVNMIKPHSNWQGPVWPIASYIFFHALLNYGFQKEAEKLAKVTAEVILNDIQSSGGMHENYNAETGEPLAAPNFVSWNILVPNMLQEASTGRNPFKI